MLRATWEKTTNPIIRFLSRPDRPKVIIHKSLLLSRPTGSRYRCARSRSSERFADWRTSKPVRVWLYYDGTPQQLSTQTELVLDIPGGGFIAMNPQHHEERLLRWAKQLKRPVLAIDYSKVSSFMLLKAADLTKGSTGARVSISVRNRRMHRRLQALARISRSVYRDGRRKTALCCSLW